MSKRITELAVMKRGSVGGFGIGRKSNVQRYPVFSVSFLASFVCDERSQNEAVASKSL